MALVKNISQIILQEFLQDWIKSLEIGALGVNTGYQLFQENSLVFIT